MSVQSDKEPAFWQQNLTALLEYYTSTPAVLICSLLVVSLAVLLPFTPLGRFLGFVVPPLQFFFILASMVIVYLVMVEAVKQWFYKRYVLSKGIFQWPL